MRIVERLQRNVELIRQCGLGAFKRFGAEDGIAKVMLKGVGPVYLRFDESDLATFQQVFHGREYDLKHTGGAAQRVTARYEAILAAGGKPIIIDAGANVGAASLWFSRQFPKATIIAVEPDPANLKVLKLNTASLDSVRIVEAAIAGERGNISLEHGEFGWAVQTVRSDDGAFAAVTMTDLLGHISGGVPFIAKIDIEGFEADLFTGDLGWIDQMSWITVEPHDWLYPGRGTSRTFQSEMGKRDFEIFIAGENLMYVARGES